MDSLKDLQDQIDKLKSEVRDLKDEHILLREEVRGRTKEDEPREEREQAQHRYDKDGFMID